MNRAFQWEDRGLNGFSRLRNGERFAWLRMCGTATVVSEPVYGTGRKETKFTRIEGPG